MKLLWLIVAGACIIVAAVFLWRTDFSTAFVVATIGTVAWFLNYRIQMKEITAAAYPPHDERKGRNPDEN